MRIYVNIRILCKHHSLATINSGVYDNIYINNMQDASVQQRSEKVQLTFACMKKKAQAYERSQPSNPLVDETHLALLVS